MSQPVVAFHVNGRAVSLLEQPGQTLLDVLRNSLDLKATRMGCAQGECGECRVIVDGHAVSSCDTPLWSLEGKQVTTVEGLGSRDAPHALQTAFIEEQAMQCGFCTSGMLMSAAALLAREPQPSRQTLMQMLDAHLCRCAAHNRVIRAIEKAATQLSAV
jgi:nicotinate dehydrogenase subunit A